MPELVRGKRARSLRIDGDALGYAVMRRELLRVIGLLVPVNIGLVVGDMAWGGVAYGVEAIPLRLAIMLAMAASWLVWRRIRRARAQGW